VPEDFLAQFPVAACVLIVTQLGLQPISPNASEERKKLWYTGYIVPWGLFLESPNNFLGPESYFMSTSFTLKIQILLVLTLSSEIIS